MTSRQRMRIYEAAENSLPVGRVVLNWWVAFMPAAASRLKHSFLTHSKRQIWKYDSSVVTNIQKYVFK